MGKLTPAHRAGAPKLRQWRCTKEVKDWVINLKQKQTLAFVKFDVEAMYPSISEELLSKSLD